MPANTIINLRKGSAVAWSGANPILSSGEPGFDLTNKILKIGDGTTPWNSLSSHFHASSDILDFNSSVSGLIPVKNILSGVGTSILNASGIFTINATGSGILSDQSQALVTTVFNKTGSTIPKMTAVYINGGQGDLPTVSLAIATSDMTSAGTYGLTYETIPNMESGLVIVFGALTGLDTDQFNPTTPQGNINGSVLYLSPYISGALTLSKPSAPNHIVAIGTVVRTHQNEGVIEVRVQNGFELEELHNVAISGATNGQFLQYNNTSGLWVPSNSGNFNTLQLNGTGVSVFGHTHISSDITNFNNSVSGLLPSISGTEYVVSSFAGNLYTISITGLQPSGNYSTVGHTHTSSNITDFNSSVSGLLPSNIITGIGISGYLNRFTSQNTVDNSVIYQSGSNIGIGTTSPSYRLHVSGSALINSSSGTTLIVSEDSNSNLNGASIQIGSAGSSAILRYSRFSALTTLRHGVQNIGGIGLQSANGTTNLYMRDTNGFIGIGTNSPSSQLHVVGTGTFSSSDSTNIITINPVGRSIECNPSTFNDINLTVNGQYIFRGLDGWTGTWADSGITTYFQIGRNAGNTIFTSLQGAPFTRLAYSANKILFTNTGSSLSIPSGYFTINTTINGGSVGTSGLVIDTTHSSSAANGQSHGALVVTPLFNTVGSNLNNIYGAYIAPRHSGVYTTTNSYGLYVNAATNISGTITNNYAAVFSGGNIGVGTVTPQTLIHGVGASAGVGSLFRLQNTSSSNNTYFETRIGTPGNFDNYIFFNRNGTNFFGATNTSQLYLPNHTQVASNRQIFSESNANAVLNLYNGSAQTELGYVSGNALRFLRSYVEVARFDGNGNFGIGTSNPSTTLDVSGVISASGGNSNLWNSAYNWIQTSGVDGSGIAGTIPVWTDNNSLTAYSNFTFNGGTLGNTAANGTIYSANIIPDVGSRNSPALTSSYFRLGFNGSLQFVNASNAGGAGVDSILAREGAGIIALKGGSSLINTPQSYRIYNTATNSTNNFERMNIGWSGNVAYINVENGSTSGSPRDLSIGTSGVNLYLTSSGNIGIGNNNPFYKLDVIGTGNFSENLLVNGTGVSLVGHTHTSSNITDFNSSVSGLLPTISNSGDNRLLTSTGSSVGIDAESNLTFDGSTLNVDGNLVFDSFTESVVAIGNSSTSQTLSLASGTVQTCTLTGNCTFTMPTATAGKSFTMFLNSGSGNYTASFSGVLWSDSAPPTITTTASKVDILSFISDGTYWYGSYSQNYG